jgi:hypothetical protein
MEKEIPGILFDNCHYGLLGLVNDVLDLSEEYLNTVEKLACKPRGKETNL